MLLQEGKPWEAFAQAERARARAFLQTVGNHRLNAEHGAEPRLVREAEILRTEIAAKEREVQQAQGEAAKRMDADLEQMRQRYRLLLTRVKVSNPEYESLTNVQPLRVEDVRRELPPDTTLISYFLSPKFVNAWVMDSAQARHVALPLEAPGLERIICWARQFGPPADVRGVKVLGTCDSSATSQEAFDQLFAPLLSAIHHQKLVVVPHGALHYVPFAALRNRRTGRYLIDDYILTYIPSASALRFLREKESPVDGGALILGDPETSMSRLPGAAEEASFVARRFGATAHLGADAREELLYSAGGRFDLVHLAAHGIYDPKNPLFSRIALAKDERHDGSLTVDEILSTLDLAGVNLVVLSACQSAAGVRSGGDEVVGLTRALLYAGTPGVISTLWNIDDAASAGLMQEFYRRLAAGTSVAEALRQSQLAVKENPRFSNPKYWAAFVLTGDPQGRWKRAD
jgi:CHAT domain-containing protein